MRVKVSSAGLKKRGAVLEVLSWHLLSGPMLFQASGDKMSPVLCQ